MLAVSLLLSSLLAASAIAAPHQHAKREIHIIKVGADNELKFDPFAIFAQPQDEVHFVFQSKNHSVVQSSFAEPCGPKDGGFNSGFQLVAAGTADDQLPVVKYTVTTDPSQALWFYCSQAIHTPNAHCAKGMVFSINCPATGTNSFDNFLAAAKSDASATEPLVDGPPKQTDVITPLAPEPQYPGSITVPAYTAPATKTDVITLGTSTWTTTYASYPGSPDPTPAAVDGKEIKVIVGKDATLTFDPAHVVAQPRDWIVFEFQSKNHSVVQSSFAAPCTPFQSASGISAIQSNFFPVAAGAAFPTFKVQVNDTTPLYFYCSQTGHCGKGMVFAANTDESGVRSSTAFQTLAKQINGSAPAGGNNDPYGGSTPPGVASAVSVAGLGLAGAIAAVAALVL